MSALNFDATTVDPSDAFGVLPAGDYTCVIERSELKPTKAGNGTMLNLTLSVVTGEFQNRKIFARINVKNLNQQAQDIGQRQLSQLCHAIGKLKIQDTSELHLKPFVARVVIQQDKSGQYPDSNEIREYRSVSGAAAPGATTTRPVSQAAAHADQSAAAAPGATTTRPVSQAAAHADQSAPVPSPLTPFGGKPNPAVPRWARQKAST